MKQVTDLSAHGPNLRDGPTGHNFTAREVSLTRGWISARGTNERSDRPIGWRKTRFTRVGQQ